MSLSHGKTRLLFCGKVAFQGKVAVLGEIVFLGGITILSTTTQQHNNTTTQQHNNTTKAPMVGSVSGGCTYVLKVGSPHCWKSSDNLRLGVMMHYLSPSLSAGQRGPPRLMGTPVVPGWDLLT